jgi:hypothetical protein
MDTPGARRRRRRSRGLLAAAVLLLVAAGGAAATFYFYPSSRQRVIAWVQGLYTPSATSAAASPSTPQKPLSDPTPDWMTTVANNPPPITTPAKPAPAASGVPVPSPSVESHQTPSDLRTAAAAEATEKLRAAAGNDLDELAMRLRVNGMDAEHRHDYFAAQYYFQQVEKLPRDHWPSDIDNLLKAVQRHLNAAAAAVP